MTCSPSGGLLPCDPSVHGDKPRRAPGAVHRNVHGSPGHMPSKAHPQVWQVRGS